MFWVLVDLTPGSFPFGKGSLYKRMVEKVDMNNVFGDTLRVSPKGRSGDVIP